MGWFKKKEEGEAKLYSPQIKNQDENTRETISEKRLWNLKNIFIAFWIFVLFIAIGIASAFVITTFTERVILWTVLVIIYAIILFFLLEPSKLREVERRETKTVEKEVIRNVDRPVIKEVIKTVEKPVYRDVVKTVEKEVIKEVDKPVYYPVKGPKLNIPHYDYVASSLTGTYHKSNCRLSKSIKRKYRESTNDLSEFKKKGYKPCKFCVTKQVNV
ncbi:hypothetical protein KA107_03555 [Candidatus Pacearchaeota archaeon]|nr:hypothetical protein [Candidatus Pacearchaeota archaeon]